MKCTLWSNSTDCDFHFNRIALFQNAHCLLDRHKSRDFDPAEDAGRLLPNAVVGFLLRILGY